MVKISTLFYVVNNFEENQNFILSNQIFSNEKNNQQEIIVDKALNSLEFEVRNEVLQKVFDYAHKFTA